MTVHDVAAFRLRMLERTREGLATLPELALIFRGIVRPNLLQVWRNRGRLRQAGEVRGEPLYSIGEVMDMVNTKKVGAA